MCVPRPGGFVPLVILGTWLTAALPGIAAEPPDLGSLEATRQRPLFSPTRRPAPPPPADEVGEPAAPPVAAPPSIKVSGIIVGADRRVAIVRLGQNAASQQVSVGSQIEGWTVSAIEVRRIELRRDARTVTVILPDAGH